MNRFALCLLVVAFFAGCAQEEEYRYYLAVAHTRVCDGKPPDEPDGRLALLQPDTFAMRWIMGDLACSTSKYPATIERLDTILDFQNPNTLFAVGNHDLTDRSRLFAAIGKPSFYTFKKDGIVFLVLDTELDRCRISGPQLALFNEVVSEVGKEDVLVLLHHKLIWMPGHPDLDELISGVSNIGLCEGDYCLYANNFHQDIYPALWDLSESGTQVICLGGDIGARTKTFVWEENPNFFLMATGWESGDPEDRYLRFSHAVHENRLTWEYLPLPPAGRGL
jgi:hypothetical protein